MTFVHPICDLSGVRFVCLLRIIIVDLLKCICGDGTDFLRAAWRRFSAWNKSLLSHRTGGSKSKLHVPGQRSRCQQWLPPSGGSGAARFSPLPLPVYGVCRHFVAQSLQSLPPWPHCLLFCLNQFFPYLSLRKALAIGFSAYLIIQDNLPTSRSLSLIKAFIYPVPATWAS